MKSAITIPLENPGGLPKGLSSATFGKKAVRRNPIITNLLQRCKFVENMGTGIHKMKQLCFENIIPEPEFIFNDFFTVIFKRHTLNEGQHLVFSYIKHNQGVMAKTILEKLNVPFGTVDRHIRVLLKMSE